MLYFITILLVFLVLACAVIILFKKVIYFRQQRKNLQKKESEFISKLVAEEELKSGQAFQMDDFTENKTTEKEVFSMERIDNELDLNEVRALILERIDGLSEEKIRQLLKELEERQNKEQRKYSRKDFLTITDYNVGDRYYRDFIQDISASGVFIKTSQKFSVGQPILMSFMSPDNQKPFRINGKIVRVHTDGVGIKFKLESQVQELVLKSFVDMIQSG